MDVGDRECGDENRRQGKFKDESVLTSLCLLQNEETIPLYADEEQVIGYYAPRRMRQGVTRNIQCAGWERRHCSSLAKMSHHEWSHVSFYRLRLQPGWRGRRRLCPLGQMVWALMKWVCSMVQCKTTALGHQVVVRVYEIDTSHQYRDGAGTVSQNPGTDIALYKHTSPTSTTNPSGSKHQ